MDGVLTTDTAMMLSSPRSEHALAVIAFPENQLGMWNTFGGFY